MFGVFWVINILMHKKPTITSATQTIDPPIESSTQTTTPNKINIKVKNKSLKPKRLVKNKKRIHGDWFRRRFYMKNKAIIYNWSSHILEFKITPRNIITSLGIRGVAGEFNGDYEEEEHIVLPGKRLKLKNLPTYRYYLKIIKDNSVLSKRLWACSDDIVITDSNVCIQ